MHNLDIVWRLLKYDLHEVDVDCIYKIKGNIRNIIAIMEHISYWGDW